ncbi:MAG: glycosyltransferase [Pseudomonadota bacterium]
MHIWAYRSLLDALPERPWLVRHNPPALEKSLLHQVIWQLLRLPGEVARAGCDIMLNTDAGALSRVSPSVTMSRDMLSYEPGEIERYGWSKARLRLLLLRYIQNRSLRRSEGAVFLTRHAAEVIQRSCGHLRNVALIPHGVGREFSAISDRPEWPADGRSIRCLYVSNAAPYKHQWMVVEAIEILRREGYDVQLELVGGGSGKAQARLDAQIALSDPAGRFVSQVGAVPQAALPNYLKAADLFIFASSCENMPNTLIEAMTAALPIACARRGPMPEVLEDGGVYFDPEKPESIAMAVGSLIDDPALRSRVAKRAKELSSQYSWARCARETWSFLTQTHRAIGEPTNA